MTCRPSRARRRRGAVAVELAMVLPFVVMLILGVWDVGILVEAQQLMSNAAREGARLAAVGTMLDETTGVERDVTTSDVQQTVINYLTRNAINTSGVTVQFADLDNPSAADPYQAQHLDHLRVTVQMPFSNVRLILVNNLINLNPTMLTGSSDWFSVKDMDVTVPTTLPTN